MADGGLVERLLEEAEEIRGKSVAESSRKTYLSALGVYEKTMKDQIGVDPYPIDVKKMMAFLVFMKRLKRTYSTLANYVCALSFYFRSHNMDNLTEDIQFKVFQTGLRRELCATEKNPKAKDPFELEFFERIEAMVPLDVVENRRLMFCMTVAFSAFLRISELMNLRKRDIRVDLGMGRMEIFIMRSKTDQYGQGESTFLFKNDGPACPWKYLDVLETIEDDDRIVGHQTEPQLRKSLAGILRFIGVPHVERYSFHSFRRGGAHLASKNGVADCMIKAHGRWKSEAYLRYVAVDRRDAGRQVAAGLGASRAPQ